MEHGASCSDLRVSPLVPQKQYYPFWLHFPFSDPSSNFQLKEQCYYHWISIQLIQIGFLTFSIQLTDSYAPFMKEKEKKTNLEVYLGEFWPHQNNSNVRVKTALCRQCCYPKRKRNKQNKIPEYQSHLYFMLPKTAKHVCIHGRTDVQSRDGWSSRF